MKARKMKLSKSIQIQDEQLKLIEKLSNANGIAGQEHEIREIILEEIKTFADEINVDAMGNVLAIKKSRQPGAMKVMVAAHMDEVGFLITKDDEDGLFNFDIVGGVDKRQLIGKTVSIGKKHRSGIIGARPIHLTTREERNQVIPLDQLRIDTGIGKNGDIHPVIWPLLLQNSKFQAHPFVVKHWMIGWV